jgi:hypothetical protein
VAPERFICIVERSRLQCPKVPRLILMASLIPGTNIPWSLTYRMELSASAGAAVASGHNDRRRHRPSEDFMSRP